MKAMINGKMILPNEVVENKVLIFDQQIQEIADAVPEGMEVIDAKGAYVAPGFVDVHIHGAGGHDTMEGTREALEAISNKIVADGVTSFLPTTMTMDKAAVRQAFAEAKLAIDTDLPGARPVGINMEGPFISMAKKGAQNPEYVVKPDWSYIEGYEDVIRLMTIAPEEDKNQSFIKKVKKETDIRLSIGHSNATFEEALAGIDAGCSHMTHFFNGMSALNHRDPGCVGAGFSSDVFVELITDTIHIHPGLFEYIVKSKGLDRVVLITDCIMAGGLEDGEYSLGGQTVNVAGGAARLMDGTLAGSTHTLIKAVENVRTHTDLSLPEVVRMATLTPAASIGIDAIKGSLEVGKDADFVLFNEEFQVLETIIAGESRYHA